MIADRRHIAGIAFALAALLGSTAARAQDGAGVVAEGSAEAAPRAVSPTGATAEQSGAVVSAEGLGRSMPRPDSLPAEVTAALPAFEQALSVYESEIREYRDTVARVVQTEYRYRRRQISDFYEGEIEESRVEERARRMDAIAQFELFLQRYPNNPQYTPDVLFRLAELHYERSVDEYNAADRDYDRRLARYERGIEATPPEPPRKDFRQSIAIFSDLIARFPAYRQADGAYYLLSICQEEMDDFDGALASMQTLVTQYPASAFAQETWLRIGEVYFDGAEFEVARSSYERALSYGESKWYDKILFKLGWSTYLLGEYDVAITRFADLLNYYEAEGDTSVQALREEAVQYFAVSLAEEDWDIDGARDADFLLPRLDRYLADRDLSWRIEVLDRLAQMLMDIERYEYAVQLYQRLLADYPLDRENPWRNEKIVLALQRSRQEDAAFAELGRLSQIYAMGTPWYSEQERLGNTEAMAYAESLARDGLLQSANRSYVEADALAAEASRTGDPAVEARAIEGYRFAARLYAQFLEQYPNVDEAYETRMYYAQALRFATQFEDAAEQFEAVRDSELSTEFREIAASLAVTSWENALQREIDGYRLEVRAWPAYQGVRRGEVAEVPPEDEPEPETDEMEAPREVLVIEPDPLPELSLRWVAAIDTYMAMGLEAEDDPDRGVRNLFAVGKLLYDYKDFEPARERFIGVLDACREINETAYAAAFLIESYAQANDTDGLRFWSQELDRRAACVPADLREALAADLDRLAMGELAQRAEQLVNEGRFEEAAREYSRLADEYADNASTAPLGLYNAGLIYEQNLKRFELAMEQFETLIERYPESEWVDPSLVRIAVNAKKFFDFERAIDTFLTLHERGFSDVALVEYPLLDASELLEFSQRYEEAARGYIEFVDEHPDDSRAAAVLYKAGTLYELAGLERQMLDTYERFRREYGRAPSTVLIDIDSAYIDTLYRTAKYYEGRGDSRNAQRYFGQVVSEFDARQPTSPEAKYAAGEVVYSGALADYERWDAITLGETVNQQRTGIQRRTEGVPAVMAAFDEVTTYGSADWTVCAFYMKGQTYQRFADVLIGLPMPDFGGNLDAEDEYMIMLTDITTPVEDAAIREWEIAYPVMQQLGVVNQCTRDTTRQLNRVRGEQYPLQEQGIVHGQRALFSPQGMLRAPVAEEPEDDGTAPVTEDPFGGAE